MRIRLIAPLLAAAALAAPSAHAQSLGTFMWQLAPYCNVVTLGITLTAGVYTLDGYDDQCGAAQRASTVGTAFPNPDGSIGFGFTIVSTPGGTPVHVNATVSLASFGGTWSDSSGNTGTLLFTAGAGTGSPRPAPITGGLIDSARIADGTIAAADIDAGQVQRRVSGVCPADQLMTAVNADGTVQCQNPPSQAFGDITAVTAGSGLTGGGMTGDVSLAVALAGDGFATTVARSDHEHAPPAGFRSVGVGVSASSTRRPVVTTSRLDGRR